MIPTGHLYPLILRMGLLTSDEARAAGITISQAERPAFDRDPIAFYLASAGPTRRKQIEALVTPPVRIVGEIVDAA